MAPNRHDQRLSDVEAHTQKHQLLIEAIMKDAETADEKLENLTQAVFGDPTDLRHKPGVIVELSRLEEKQMETNRILTGLREDFHRVAWIVVTANIAGLLALLFKK